MNITDELRGFATDPLLGYASQEVHAEVITAIANRIEAEYKRMQAENAKLRELVSGLEHCAQGLVCDCCPLYDPSGTNHHRCESLERELGIEVDG